MTELRKHWFRMMDEISLTLGEGMAILIFAMQIMAVIAVVALTIMVIAVYAPWLFLVLGGLAAFGAYRAVTRAWRRTTE